MAQNHPRSESLGPARFLSFFFYFFLSSLPRMIPEVNRMMEFAESGAPKPRMIPRMMTTPHGEVSGGGGVAGASAETQAFPCDSPPKTMKPLQLSAQNASSRTHEHAKTTKP